MRRIGFVLISAVLGLALVFQIAAVLSEEQRSSTVLTTSPTIIDLGTLGGPHSRAADLNENGAVVGSSTIFSESASSAFYWSAGVMEALPAPMSQETAAFSLNDAGLIAGVAISLVNESQVHKPIIWSDKNFIALPLPADVSAIAQSVNHSGTVVGHTISETNNMILLWNGALLSDTIPVENGFAQTTSHNMHNHIVGSIANDGLERAFLWRDGAFADLGTLGGQESIAYDINDLGQIVGSSTISEELVAHAVLWDDGQIIDLGAIGEASSNTSRALAVNNLGQIVGEVGTDDQETKAVMWMDGNIIDLHDLLPADSDWESLLSAASINDGGWIAGTGLINGQEHAFLMHPSPPIATSYLPIIAARDLDPTPVPTPTPPVEGYDLRRFMTGDGRLYEVRLNAGSFETQARHQTQFSGVRFYHTKGNEYSAEWEELWSDQYFMYRGTDTSPGNGMYYTLYESLDDFLAGKPGSKWSLRYMQVGDKFFRRPYVVFFNKADCSLVIGGSYPDPSWLVVQAYHTTYQFNSTVTLRNVIELAWIPGDETGPTQPVDERYFYAEGYGLVGWKKPSLGWQSAIIEEHAPGERPDNMREHIGCINQTQYTPQQLSSKLSLGPLPEPYASLVRP